MRSEWISRYWYDLHRAPPKWQRLASRLFGVLVEARLSAYRHGYKKISSVSVPVVVIGNLTVGGTGKTPAVIAIAKLLLEAGYRPGIVSRGYGGRARNQPERVPVDGDPRIYGDEPVLMAQRTVCPVWVFPKRALAVEQLLAHDPCDIIIADDGLQHYALARDVEILVVDEVRQYGNGWMLPAGPLREPLSRVQAVDFIIKSGSGVAVDDAPDLTAASDFGDNVREFSMRLDGEYAVNLSNQAVRRLSSFQGEALNAVAGLGDPEKFFRYLRRYGLDPATHPFPDHHLFVASDLPAGTVLMTEKDAVKCRNIQRTDLWAVPVSAVFSATFADKLLTRLEILHGQKTA